MRAAMALWREWTVAEKVVGVLSFFLIAFLYWKRDVTSAWRVALLLCYGMALPRIVRLGTWKLISLEDRQCMGIWLFFVAWIVGVSLAGNSLRDDPAGFLIDFLLPAFWPIAILGFLGQQRDIKLLWTAAVAGACLGIGQDLAQYVREARTAGYLLSEDVVVHRRYADPLLTFMPFVLALAIRAKAWKPATAWGTVSVLALILVVLTAGRGPWLAAVAIVAVFVVATRDRRLLWAVGICLALLAIGLATFIPYELVAGRMARGFDTSLRTKGTWLPALEIIRDHPWFGYGIGDNVFHVEFNRRAPSSPEWAIHESLGPHNMFLSIWFAGGLIGLLLFLTAFGILVWKMIVRLRTIDRAQDDSVYLFGVAVLASLLGNYFVNAMTDGRRWTAYAMLVGMAMTWLNVKPRESMEKHRIHYKAGVLN